MTNRLAREASPYLQQHAHNPVDWYPWGPEALERAKREDRPILLSIGYSACHWCHVMERESFEDRETAALMNDGFVSVKVDREERPDLDHVYQLVVQLMGRSGGWPLTVLLTPEQRPFFGGTYFPPVDRYGMPSFRKVLVAALSAYRDRREQVDAQAAELAEAIARAASGPGGGDSDAEDAEVAATSPGVSAELVDRALERVAARFDDVHGGFGQRPKFPNTMALELLLRGRRPGDRERACKALDAMRAGGVWDHLGGGFHRYSTDERWLVPHFEKMLYDNALLARLYVDGWRATRNIAYAETAREVAEYVAREMTAPSGGFYATEDADSEGEEGKYFVWTPAQIAEACGPDLEAARVATAAYGVGPRGHFEGTGASVLSRAVPLDSVAAVLEMTPEEAVVALERAREAMLSARARRVKPFRDEKILASWNALMASGLAAAGSALGDAAMVEAAVRAMRFIEAALVSPEGGARARVARHVKEGVARGPGFLDDHAFVADAALDLYEVTSDASWVRLARQIAEAILAHFRDATDGAFYFAPDDGEALFVRPKDAFDHAVPSGASVAARVLLRLGTLVDPRYGELGARAVEQRAAAAAQNPLAMSVTVALADRLVRGSTDVVLVGPRESPATQALATQVHRAYLPDRVLAWADASDMRALEACAVLAEGKASLGEPVAYVCRGRTCSLPTARPEELGRMLDV
jgi:uncharacterized protein YyaL (SSP411 family)